MKKRRYVYEVLLAPNKEDDLTPPVTTLRTFKNDTNTKKTFKN